MAKCGLCCGGGKMSGVYIAAFGALVSGAIVGAAHRDDDKKPAKTPASTPAATPATPAQPEGTSSDDSKTTEAPKVDPYVLGFTMKDIEGNDKNLADFKGSVVMMVNVASQCGFTYQYKGLEALYQSKKADGLVIVGFPANNFGGQEPGTDKDIKEFCTSKYSVTFPMFSKVSVKGDDICPLYKKLTTQPAPLGGDVGWNFTKFLVDRNGNVVAKFDSRVKPEDTELLRKIDELLAAKK